MAFGCILVLAMATFALGQKRVKSRQALNLIYLGVIAIGYLLISYLNGEYPRSQATQLLVGTAIVLLLVFRILRIRSNRRLLPRELNRVSKAFRDFQTKISGQNLDLTDHVRLHQKVILGAGLLYQNSPGKLRRLGYSFTGEYIIPTEGFTVTIDIQYSECDNEIRRLCEYVTLHDGKYLTFFVEKL